MKDITSLAWWISVIIIGVSINILTWYLKPKIDNFLAKYSTRIRESREKKDKKIKLTIEKLKNDKHEQTMLAITINSLRIRGLTYFILALMLFILSALFREIVPVYTIQSKLVVAFNHIFYIIANIFSLVSFTIGMRVIFFAFFKRDILLKSRENKNNL